MNDDNNYSLSNQNDTSKSKKNGRGQNSGNFANRDPQEVRDIAAKGGRAAHDKGTAHKWNSKEAQEAGRLGGQSRGRNSSDLGDDSDDSNL